MVIIICVSEVCLWKREEMCAAIWPERENSVKATYMKKLFAPDCEA